MEGHQCTHSAEPSNDFQKSSTVPIITQLFDTGTQTSQTYLIEVTHEEQGRSTTQTPPVMLQICLEHRALCQAELAKQEYSRWSKATKNSSNSRKTTQENYMAT